jgi:hypothetical protein
LAARIKDTIAANPSAQSSKSLVQHPDTHVVVSGLLTDNTLARAFRTSGTRNIPMTLWLVDDNLTQVFMARFCQNWLYGAKPKALAA